MIFLEVPVIVDKNLDEVAKQKEFGIDIDIRTGVANSLIVMNENEGCYIYENRNNQTTLSCNDNDTTFLVDLPYEQLRLMILELYENKNNT